MANVYEVELTVSVTVEVSAYNEDDASEKAIEMFNNGDIDYDVESSNISKLDSDPDGYDEWRDMYYEHCED